MAKRITTKIGDIFEVILGDGTKAYFQYLMRDITQLNGDVIKVFKQKYDKESVVSIEMILADEVDFYIHTSVHAGAKLNLWHKVGYVKVMDGHERPWFIGSLDSGNTDIELSKRWQVWQAGDDDFTYVGVLPPKYHHLEGGGIYPPFAIVNRIEKGDTGFKMHKFK